MGMRGSVVERKLSVMRAAGLIRTACNLYPGDGVGEEQEGDTIRGNRLTTSGRRTTRREGGVTRGGGRRITGADE